ncbi:MAG: hypothetical protein EBW05_08285, partial [Betaproteobacteria bacterium]|nr:hypothetical protein [Betaproteobacteria bacterium]
KAASRLTQSPLVAQLTVRAIESALQKTHVALPGFNDKAAIIELRNDAVSEAKSASTAKAAKAEHADVQDRKALDQLKANIAAGRFSIDETTIASSLVRH